MKPAEVPENQNEMLDSQPVADTPVPQAQTPKPAPPTPLARGSDSNNRTFIIVAFILLLIGAGAVAAYVYLDRQNSDKQSSADSQPQTEIPAEIEYATSTLDSNFDENGYTASVTHPSGWEVIKSSDTSDINYLVVGSPKGHWLQISDLIGASPTACGIDEDPDTITYTLAKKLPTAVEGLYFTSYQYEDTTTSLEIEDFNAEGVPELHKQLTEGQSNTGLCDNRIGNGYKLAVYKNAWIHLKDSNVYGEGNGLTAEDIANDPEFVEMLNTLKLVDKLSN